MDASQFPMLAKGLASVDRAALKKHLNGIAHPHQGAAA
jgi:hypothetical protein